jgi:hypothetical protein
VNPKRRQLLEWSDRGLAILLGLMVLGSALAFGGGVWWWRPLGAFLGTALVALGLFRAALEGRLAIWKSPLPVLGILIIALGCAQLMPWPRALASRLSPEAQALHSRGVLPSRVFADDPSAELPEAMGIRTPLTVDRPATLRWLFDAGLVLIVFIVSGRFVTRLRNLSIVWGVVVAAFGLNAALGFVQVTGGALGFFGFMEPGRAGPLGPSTLQNLSAPGEHIFTSFVPNDPLLGPWGVERRLAGAGLGTMAGGAGAILAIGALGLPLALSLALHLIAPRGSRDRFFDRLSAGYQIGLLGVLLVVVLLGSGVIGVLAGSGLALPFAMGLLVAGLPAAFGTGLRWWAVGLTGMALVCLTLGVGLGGWFEPSGPAAAWAAERDLSASKSVWNDSTQIVRDFALIGTGMGTFGSIYPSYKSTELASTTARSSLVQFGIESGIAGVMVLGLALLWCAARVAPSLVRVGTADRALSWGAIGTALCFGTFAAVHWSLEVPAVALAAAAWAGTCDRWLAGGTDLFVEPST